MIQAMSGIQQHPQQQSINVREALGMLVAGLIENVKILELLNNEQLKGLCRLYMPTTPVQYALEASSLNIRRS